MLSTFAIDDDVLAAVKELADAERKSIGEVLSTLARSALGTVHRSGGVRNGIPLLPVGPNSVPVTCEMVKQLAEELDWFGSCSM